MNSTLARTLAALVVCFCPSTTTRGEEIESPPIEVAGPISVAVIYPVIKLNQEFIEEIPPIEDGYSLWGRLVVTDMLSSYLTAPMSYPSDSRLTELRACGRS